MVDVSDPTQPVVVGALDVGRTHKLDAAGDFVYVSGQVPAKDGEIIAGGIVAQTEQVMQNLIEVLAIADCRLEHVVKVNCWLDDPRDFTSFNSVFAKYFSAHPPARSTVQSALMVDAKVEMDVIAYKPV